MILDTSGLLAALDPDELMHAACRNAMESEGGRLVVSPLVLCELDYLLGQRTTVRRRADVLRDMERGAIELAELSPSDVGAAVEVMAQYPDLNTRLTGAHLVVLASAHPDEAILTLDERHFRAVTRADRSALTLYPADMIDDGR